MNFLLCLITLISSLVLRPANASVFSNFFSTETTSETAFNFKIIDKIPPHGCQTVQEKQSISEKLTEHISSFVKSSSIFASSDIAQFVNYLKKTYENKKAGELIIAYPHNLNLAIIEQMLIQHNTCIDSKYFFKELLIILNRITLTPRSEVSCMA